MEITMATVLTAMRSNVMAVSMDVYQSLTWSNIIYFYGPTLITAVTIYTLYKWLLWPLISPLAKIPSTPYNPLLGDVLELRNSDTMEWAIKLNKQLGPIHRYFFFLGNSVISLTGPDEMKHVLVTNSRNYDRSARIRKTLGELMGNGLLSSTGPVHAMHRKLLNPAFNHTSIKGMLQSFQKYASELRHYWHETLADVVDGDYMQQVIQQDLGRCTLDITGECAFGYQFDAIWKPEKKLTKTFSAILQGALTGSSLKNLIPFYRYVPTEENRILKEAVLLVKQTVLDVIAKRRQDMEDEIEQPRDLLYLLMMAKDEVTGQGLSDQELQDQVITFMFAGQETTSTGVTWTLHCLSQHPEIQEKVRQEILTVLPNGDENITWEHLEKLQYLKAVVNESLRLFPPVPLIPKEALDDDMIGPYYIPAGTFLLLQAGAMHRNPNVWPDPTIFNPDRFTDPDNLPKPYTFLPFSLGRRSCIGNKFALIAMRVILSQILRDLKFMPVPGFKFKRILRITMRPQPPMQLNISKT
ncbi:cytochrome P450 4A5-like [Glandiceps talaboti]